MPPEINALIDKPHLLIIVLLVGAIVGMAVEQFRSKMRRQAWREKNRWRWARKWNEPKITGGPWLAADRASSKQPDAADQLRIVMGANFSIQPLLNKSEVRVFKELTRIVISCNPGWQVMAQVSLGEVLRSRDPEAYGCIKWPTSIASQLKGRPCGAAVAIPAGSEEPIAARNWA